MGSEKGELVQFDVALLLELYGRVRVHLAVLLYRGIRLVFFAFCDSLIRFTSSVVNAVLYVVFCERLLRFVLQRLPCALWSSWSKRNTSCTVKFFVWTTI